MSKAITVDCRCTVWITLMSSNSADIISGAFVRRGFGVAAAATTKEPVYDPEERNACRMLALQLQFDAPKGEEDYRDWMFSEILATLRPTGIMWYSCVMSMTQGTTGTKWGVGNVLLPKKDATAQGDGPYRSPPTVIG